MLKLKNQENENIANGFIYVVIKQYHVFLPCQTLIYDTWREQCLTTTFFVTSNHPSSLDKQFQSVKKEILGASKIKL